MKVYRITYTIGLTPTDVRFARSEVEAQLVREEIIRRWSTEVTRDLVEKNTVVEELDHFPMHSD